MFIRNTTAAAIYAAADSIGAHVDVRNVNAKGTSYRAKLTPGPDCEWRRVSSSGRMVNAVCWHGWRDFFRALFRLSPEAITRTHVVYTAHTFESEYRKSRIQGQPMSRDGVNVSLCRCPEKGRTF